MIVVNSVTVAKANLSSLIEKVIAGQEVIISKSNRPMVVMTAYHGPLKKRKPGALRGKIRIAKDFDLLPAHIALAFGAGQK